MTPDLSLDTDANRCSCHAAAGCRRQLNGRHHVVRLSLRCVALLASMMAMSDSYACKCIGEASFVKETEGAVRVLESQSRVFHARVIDVFQDGSGQIQVIEVLKGSSPPNLLRPTKDNTSCEIRLVKGEEFIYLPVADGTVGHCSQVAPKPEVLRAIRSMLAKRRKAP